MSYGSSVIVNRPFADTVQRVREGLGQEGFGVLTEINLTTAMREKLGKDIEEYVILGACNPPLAYAALQADRGIGLLLPCNVVVRAVPEGTLVEALDPQVMVAVSGNAQLSSVADDAADRLKRVLHRLSA